MKQTSLDHIVICVGTIQRPKLLRSNLESLGRLKSSEGTRITILVVDNSSDCSSKGVVEELSGKIEYPVKYVWEKERGIVCMRNRSLDEAGALEADFLAFIDDDEVAEEDWIVALYNGLKKYQAQVVQGTTFRHIPEDTPKWLRKNGLLKLSNHQTGTVRSSASTRNLMCDFSFIAKHNLRFNMAFNLMGSSDSFLFKQANSLGARMVWIDEARVTEYLPESRLSLKWIVQRAFRTGHNIFEMKKQSGKVIAMVLSVLQHAFYIWFMALIALITFPFSKSLSVYIFQLSARACGFFARAFGVKYHEYSKIHGE